VERLYRGAAPRLYTRALFLAQGNRAQADDLQQQVFQAAIIGWETVSRMDSGKQMAWLHTVLRNKAADSWRANGRESPFAEWIPDKPEPAQDPAHDAQCSIAADKALKVIKEMPPVRHRVACLRLLYGLPTREVARMIGIAESTVRGHLKTARDELVNEVGPILLFEDDEPGGGLPQEGR